MEKINSNCDLGAPKQSQINEKVNVLADTLNRLGGVVEDLDCRLNGVLREVVPEPCEVDSVKEVEQLVPLARDIKSIGVDAFRVESRLLDIIRRLEL